MKLICSVKDCGKRAMFSIQLANWTKYACDDRDHLVTQTPNNACVTKLSKSVKPIVPRESKCYTI